MMTTLLLIFAAVGIRDAVFNCSVSLLRTERWKTFLAGNKYFRPQIAYNEIFFSFSIQHALAHLAFAATGALCLVDPDSVSTDFIRVLFLHHFVWDVSVFVRDWKYFSPKFRKFYGIHHAMTSLLGITWTLLGVFDKLAGVGGFFVLVFLGSSFTSSLSFFLRMFAERGSTFYVTDMCLSIVQRVWRWGIIVSCIRLVYAFNAQGKGDETMTLVTILITGLLMESFDAYIHTKYIITNWQNHRQSKLSRKNNPQEADEETGGRRPAKGSMVNETGSIDKTWSKLSREKNPQEDNEETGGLDKTWTLDADRLQMNEETPNTSEDDSEDDSHADV